MHTIKVLAFGSENFNTSLEELKDHLNFKLTVFSDNFESIVTDEYDILLIHEECLDNVIKLKKDLLEKKKDKFKILATHSPTTSSSIFSDQLFLPISLKDLNQIIENTVVKKNFNKNSSIKIKGYILNKNEKKLIKNKNYALLTEKEIQLLELFLSYSHPLSKDKILGDVWKYSSDADTHTVETHIYRLRKKIKEIFSDEKFILNDKKGYLL